MKKFTSFLSVALLLGGFSTARADLVPELQGNMRVVASDEPLMDVSEIAINEGWYLISQNRGGEGFMYDEASLDEASVQRHKRSSFYNKGYALASEIGSALVRFEEGSTPGSYRMRFGTDRYISHLLKENQSFQTLTSGSDDDAADLFVYVTKTDGITNEGCFAINFVTAAGGYGDKVDTDSYNGEIAPVVTWQSGLNTSATGNNIWTIYSVSFEESDELDLAYAGFYPIITEYMLKLSIFDGKTSMNGTPGTYSETAVAAFRTAITEGENVNKAWAEHSTEEMQAAGRKIVDTYNAAIATYVSSVMDITPGYYFIASHRKFYEDVAEEGGTGEGTVWMNKYIYARSNSGNIRAGWASMEEGANKAQYLWKITKPEGADKKFRVESVATDATFTDNPTVLSLESDSLIQFDYIVKEVGKDDENDTIFYSLRISSQTDNVANAFHALGHSEGRGTEGSFVKWNSASWASQWALIPVSEEEAAIIIEAYAPIKNNADLQTKAKQIIADAEPKMVIALDCKEEIVDGALITDVVQLSSPYTCSESMEPGSGLDKLIDENKNGTYWHSVWSGADNNIATGHYLQIQLPEGSIDHVVAEIGRRAGSMNGHPIAFDVYGTDDPNAAKEACTFLGKVTAPYTGSDQVVWSTFVPTGGKAYLRYYATDCYGEVENFRTFWHAAHFQLYKVNVTENPTSQAKGMGEIFTNMQSAVEAAKADGDGKVTVEHFEALLAASEAFNARFVNPDTLRSIIEANKNVPDMLVVGTNPGQWYDKSLCNLLLDRIAAATDYDAKGVYYPQLSAGYVKAIEYAKKAMFESANPVRTDKWYNFRFATEEMYDKYGWDKEPANANTLLRVFDDGFVNYGEWPSLYGKVMGVGKEIMTPYIKDDTTHYTHNYNVAENIDNVAMGNQLYLLTDAEVEKNPDAAMFRFIPSGDTAYIIQNKATGLYLRATDARGAVNLSIQPTLWKNQAMGAGKMMCTGTDIAGRNCNQLHSHRNGSNLVTLDATGVESNTGFLIEEVGTVEDWYAKDNFKMSLMPNAIYGFCYPVDVTPVSDDLYVYGVSLKGTEVTLTVFEDNTAKAGTPFIFLTGMDEFDANATPELYEFTFGGTLTSVPDTTTVHKGTYFSARAPRGSIIANGEGAFWALRYNTDISANTTWIDAKVENPASAEITYTIDEGTSDCIKTAVSNANKGGDIYTVEGTYVGKGNIATVKGLRKGLYIVNGVKVLVK